VEHLVHLALIHHQVQQVHREQPELVD